LPSWGLVEFTPHVGEEIDWDDKRAVDRTPEEATAARGEFF
jgi:hypothetical protein